MLLSHMHGKLVGLTFVYVKLESHELVMSLLTASDTFQITGSKYIIMRLYDLVKYFSYIRLQ